MRRFVAAFTVVALAATTAACSSSSTPTATSAQSTLAPSTAQVATSRAFDEPFAYATETGEATLTISGLRLESSYNFDHPILVVDVRAVQSAGQPEIAPTNLQAFDPNGREFSRIEPSESGMANPLIASIMYAPGEEVVGMVAWDLPVGAWVGRLDVTTVSGVNSLTVARQPTNNNTEQNTTS